MNRKATPFVALVVAATVAAAPMASAGAAATAPAVSAASVANAPLSPVQVVQSVSGATGALARPVGAGTAQTPAVAPLVVVTGDAAPATAAKAAASADPIALPKVPDAVTAALDLAGLPVAAVWRVFQTGNGIYTVFYKLAFNTIPNALLKGQWGSIPTAIGTAINDSFTWIATGAGPKAPGTGTTPAASSSTTTAGPAVPSVFTSALDVVGIPVATAWATFQAANSVYTNFTSLVSTVPNAFLSGNWGKIPTLVVDAVSKSITTIVDFPGTQLKAAQDKIDKLIASLAPAPVVPTVTSTDVQAGLRTASSSASSADSVVAGGSTTSAVEATSTSKTPEAAEPKTVVAAEKPVESKPVVATAKPVVEAEKPAEKPVVEAEKPAEKPVVEAEKPAEKPAVEAEKPAEKPAVEAEKPAEKPAVEAEKPAEKPAAATEKPAESTATSDKTESTVEPSSK